MDQYVLSYCVIYQMDQSILNSIFFKFVATDITIVATGINNSYVAMSIDNSYVETRIDDVIMPVATILL
jgi:hypothetical protein